MASPVFIPKKSTIASKVPTTSDLQLGEICVNHSDRKIFARHPNGTVYQLSGSSIGDTAPTNPGSGQIWVDTTTLRLFVWHDDAWVELSQSYLGTREARSEWASPYHYLGFATSGTAESATSWTITRTTISASGEITAEQSAVGAWSSRASLSYS
jgi:hypothetical protein